MKGLVLFLTLLFAVAAFPQTANIVELSPADASQAKSAYDALQKAQADWDAAQKHIQEKYKGFDYGIEFSKDFKFIVPKQLQVNNNWNCTTTIAPCTNCVTTAPYWKFQ